ncbi:MAG: deoxyribonuclease IV [Patescibacteria group bacterium]
MNIGAHVSIAGGVFHAPENADRIGCECFQIFTRSPRGGRAPELTDEIVSKFKSEKKKYKLKNVYVHAPYFINFASGKKRVVKGSVEVLREELERASLLGVTALMTHLGSAKDVGEEKAVEMTIVGIQEVLKGYTGKTQLLLENAAGQGSVVGDTFEELAAIIEGVEKNKQYKNMLGVCVDTCHAFASGYDIRDKKTLKATLDEFDDVVGLDRLVVLHCNDSKNDFNTKKDRHDNIGKGFIGKKAFQAIMKSSRLKKVDCILETPWVDGEKSIITDIKYMKKLRDTK